MTGPRCRSISGHVVERLSADRDTVFWDRALPGFGVRVYPSGSKVYVVQTRAGGRSRRITVGRHGVLPAGRAREMAASIIARIKAGEEPVPVSARPEPEAGPSVAGLAERYLREHVAVHCKPSSAAHYRRVVVKHILPALGAVPVEAVGRRDVETLHRRLCDKPSMANVVMDVLKKMFNLAEGWGLRRDGSNPCRSVRKYEERKRERFLTVEEFRRLGRVLDEVDAEGSAWPPATAALRLLMLTGCRKSEVLALRWEDVDLEAGELRLRDTKTGARTVPLSPEAAGVLAGERRVPGSPWVIPGRKPGGHLRNIDELWRRIRTRAGLDDVRIHDLRHSFASRALALGESLPMIGKLLGHTQIQTTARYAHLARDSVKASASRVADSIRAELAAGGDAGNAGR